MASVRYGSIVTEIAGKLGGHVLQRCGQSLSMRTGGKPSVPLSASQLQSRVFMGSVAQAWKSLSDSEQLSWITNAASWPAFDRLGNKIVLTGYQAYLKSQKVQSIVSAPLVNITTAWHNIGGYVGDVNEFDISIESFLVYINGPLPDNHYMIVYVTDALPRLSSSVGSTMYVAHILEPASDGEYDIYSNVYNAMRKRPVVGNSLRVLFRIIDISTGIWCDDKLVAKVAV